MYAADGLHVDISVLHVRNHMRWLQNCCAVTFLKHFITKSFTADLWAKDLRGVIVNKNCFVCCSSIKTACEIVL